MNFNSGSSYVGVHEVAELDAKIGQVVRHLFTDYDIDWIEWRQDAPLDAQGIVTLRSRKDGSTRRIGARTLSTWLWGR